MAGKWTSWTEGLRRRFGDLSAREQRALLVLAAAVVAFGVGIIVFLVQSNLSARAERNHGNAEVLRMIRDKGKAYRDWMAKQEELNQRLGAEAPALPSILGEVLGELGQQRQDFQELPPETFGPANVKRKPWLRSSVKFPLRKVSAQLVFEFLLKLRERYPDLPLAVTSLDMRLDRSEDNLYNVEMVVSAYRLAEQRSREGGRGDEGKAAAEKATGTPASAGGATP
jgi:hypothetical protein